MIFFEILKIDMTHLHPLCSSYHPWAVSTSRCSQLYCIIQCYISILMTNLHCNWLALYSNQWQHCLWHHSYLPLWRKDWIHLLPWCQSLAAEIIKPPSAIIITLETKLINMYSRTNETNYAWFNFILPKVIIYWCTYPPTALYSYKKRSAIYLVF